MGLIDCPDCNTQVSSNAQACPKCGCPINTDVDQAAMRTRTNWKRIVGWISAVLLCIAVVVLYCYRDDIVLSKQQYFDLQTGQVTTTTTTLTGTHKTVRKW